MRSVNRVAEPPARISIAEQAFAHPVGRRAQMAALASPLPTAAKRQPPVLLRR